MAVNALRIERLEFIDGQIRHIKSNMSNRPSVIRELATAICAPLENCEKCIRPCLTGAFAAYDDDKECHLFEMNANVSTALKSCLASESNSLSSAANLFSRVTASIALDFKGKWFFKADGGNAFAMSLVISNEDGTIVVDRTEYFDTAATATAAAVFEQAATLRAGTYTIEMFTITTSEAG